MDDYQKTFDSWNNLAEDYEARFMNFKLYDDTYDFFFDLIKKWQEKSA